MSYDVAYYDGDESVVHLSMAADGGHHRLMRYAWKNGSIPNDLRKIGNIIKATSTREFDSVWAELQDLWPIDEANPSRRFNPKLQHEMEYRDRKSGKASRSARIRWEQERQKEAAAAAAEPFARSSDGMRSHMRTHSEGNASPLFSTQLSSTELSDRTDPAKSTQPPVEKPAGGRSGPKSPDADLRDRKQAWAPVDQYLRKTVAGDVYRKHYWGILIVAWTGSSIKLAVPKALIDDYGLECAAADLAIRIRNSGIDVARDRLMSLVSIESACAVMPEDIALASQADTGVPV